MELKKYFYHVVLKFFFFFLLNLKFRDIFESHKNPIQRGKSFYRQYKKHLIDF